MTSCKRYLVTVAISLVGMGSSQGSIVHYDSSAVSSLGAANWRYEAGDLLVPFAEKNNGDGKLKSSLSPFINVFGMRHSAHVDLPSLFDLADDAHPERGVFETGIPAVSMDQVGSPDSPDDFFELLLGEGDSSRFFGWSRSVAVVDKVLSAQDSNVLPGIEHEALDAFAADSYIVGAIPEPAVVTLVIGFGGALLFVRRMLMKT